LQGLIADSNILASAGVIIQRLVSVCCILTATGIGILTPAYPWRCCKTHQKIRFPLNTNEDRARAIASADDMPAIRYGTRQQLVTARLLRQQQIPAKNKSRAQG